MSLFGKATTYRGTNVVTSDEMVHVEQAFKDIGKEIDEAKTTL